MTPPHPTGATGLHVVEVDARPAAPRSLVPSAPPAAPRPTRGQPLRVGVAQMAAPVGDVDARLAQAERLVDACVAEGARWVVLPEFYSSGVADTDAVRAAVSEPDGPAVRLLADLAARHGVVTVASLLLREGVDVRNAQLVHGPGGLLARHDKDLPTMWENALYVGGEPGDDGFAVVDRVPVGLALCWELTRPRTVRRLAGRVDLVCAGSGWWSIPAWHPRPVFRRAERANRERARAAPALFARYVGAPVAHAAHTGPLTSRALGLPVDYAGRYEGGTGIWSGDGEPLALVDPDGGAGTAVADVPLGAVPAALRPSGTWLTEPGALPRYAWTVQRALGRRSYARERRQRVG